MHMCMGLKLEREGNRENRTREWLRKSPHHFWFVFSFLLFRIQE